MAANASMNDLMQTGNKPLFSTPELEHRIELIQHLIKHSTYPVIIKGAAGSGKTSLLMLLTEYLDKDFQVRSVTVYSNNDVLDINVL